MGQALLLLVVVGVSMTLGRLGALALTVTGVPREIAKFQARSALTGAGFTTSESESIVNHPARRRIIMFLMLVGAIGGAGAIASLIGTFANTGTWGTGIRNAGILAAGLFGLVFLSRLRWIDVWLQRAFAGVIKRFTEVDLRDYRGLLRVSGDFGVQEIYVERGDWLADRPLSELDLSHEGILVLGIVTHDHDYVGAPKGESTAHPGDTMILYGRDARLAELDERRRGYAGERAHREAKEEQRRIEEEQRARRSDENPETDAPADDPQPPSDALGSPPDQRPPWANGTGNSNGEGPADGDATPRTHSRHRARPPKSHGERSDRGGQPA